MFLLTDSDMDAGHHHAVLGRVCFFIDRHHEPCRLHTSVRPCTVFFCPGIAPWLHHNFNIIASSSDDNGHQLLAGRAGYTTLVEA